MILLKLVVFFFCFEYGGGGNNLPKFVIAVIVLGASIPAALVGLDSDWEEKKTQR